jgi:hypothetical protein
MAGGYDHVTALIVLILPQSPQARTYHYLLPCTCCAPEPGCPARRDSLPIGRLGVEQPQR